MTSGQLYIPNFYMAFRETEIVHRVSMYSSNGVSPWPILYKCKFVQFVAMISTNSAQIL